MISPKVLDRLKSIPRLLLIRLVGVKISDIVSGNYQINSVDDTEEMLSLYNAMDTIRGRYGEQSIMRASSMGAKTIGRFQNPFSGEPPILAHRKQ